MSGAGNGSRAAAVVREWRQAPIRATCCSNVTSGVAVRAKQFGAVMIRDGQLAMRTPLKTLLKVLLLSLLVVMLYTVQSLILTFTTDGINLKSDVLADIPRCRSLDGTDCHSIVYAPADDVEVNRLVRQMAFRNNPSLSMAPPGSPPGTPGYDVLGLADLNNMTQFLATTTSRQYVAVNFSVALAPPPPPSNVTAKRAMDVYEYTILYNASGIATTLFDASGYYDYSLEVQRLLEETIVARYAPLPPEAGDLAASVRTRSYTPSPLFTYSVRLMRFPIPVAALNIATAQYAPDFLATYGLSGLVFFAQIAFFILTANIILNERDSYTRDGLKIMGLKDSVYFGGIFFSNMILCLLGAALALGVGKIVGIPYFEASAAFVLLTLLWGFLAMVAFALFVTTLARSRALANVVFMVVILMGGGCAGLFSTFLAYHVFALGPFIVTICSLFPPFNFCKAMADVTMAVMYTFDSETQSYVQSGPGFSWANRDDTFWIRERFPHLNELPSPADSLNALFFNVVIYLVLGFYLDAVRPGKSGSARPWYFLCTPRFYGFYSAPDDTTAGSHLPAMSDRHALSLVTKHMPDDVAAEFMSVLVSASAHTSDSMPSASESQWASCASSAGGPNAGEAYFGSPKESDSLLAVPVRGHGRATYSSIAPVGMGGVSPPAGASLASSEGSINGTAALSEQQAESFEDSSASSASAPFLAWRSSASWSASGESDGEGLAGRANVGGDPGGEMGGVDGLDPASRVSALLQRTAAQKLSLRLVGLTKLFHSRSAGRDGVLALDQLTLGARAGDVLCLLGHNGASKTTTINVLTGLLTPTAGDVFVDGYSVVHQIDRHDLGWGELTVAEHLAFFARIKGVRESEIRDAVDECLGAVNLVGDANRQVKGLSGGTRRRLSVVAATLGSPSVLVFDEPTNGMDVHNRRLVWELVHSLALSGRTVVLTTNDMEEANQLGTKIAVMSSGRIRAVDSTQALKRRFGGGYKVTLVPQPQPVDELTGLIPQLLPSARVMAGGGSGRAMVVSLAAAAAPELGAFFRYMERVAGGAVVADWAVEKTGMEDVFLAIMGSVGHDDAFSGYGAPSRIEALARDQRQHAVSLAVAFESEPAPLGSIPITSTTTLAQLRSLIGQLLDNAPLAYAFLGPGSGVPLTEAQEHVTLAVDMAPLAVIRNTELEQRRREGQLSLAEELAFERERVGVLSQRVTALQSQLAEAKAAAAEAQAAQPASSSWFW
ncbi:uncharacterized protein AMSG_03880 [Thecamonas trahens ATCC 50062]|uniref:ABC transporter domain-containing protein n=1 Tax=Thecamonas trahens ATCC 50062 TaxID=461836 RepID=A0A0L0D638_THETB|nr:hypothetical protein AMSG_03880 [Thecamonas trahens ATCC 50062]KNC47650.1 hypothetical protein AMSG_03880 [Thecamonas trahens ATCC 50062]|eukprot:XP_013759134.1 hypothetical protein AMSG_03880 [Thecamonas trahens ATCC 50062]